MVYNHHGYPETIARSKGVVVDLVNGAIKYTFLHFGYAEAMSDVDKVIQGFL